MRNLEHVGATRHPFALYLHIPYCQAKCPYCDFNSYAAARWPEAGYVDTLCRELDAYAAQATWAGRVVRTIFFGGGTPSLFAPASIARVLDHVRRLWSVEADAETTLETNPGTVTAERLRGFRDAGITRLSIGVQSFAPQHLQTLGRIHDAADAVRAVAWAGDAGFDNVGVDLMFAVPQQTLAEWEADLAQACALGPAHISAYNLTYEEGTPFHLWRAQGRLRPQVDDTELAMFTRTQELLAAAGYEQYEISNYARPSRVCRHNLNYWRGGDYLGVGAGAHSYAALADAAATDEPGAAARWGRRWSNELQPTRYRVLVGAQGHARVTEETLELRQACGEFMFLGLRCRDGIAAAAFHERFGVELAGMFPHVHALCADGLLEAHAGRWRLTPDGLRLADGVFATFL
jgi:oxygen-independent coproporphyrinogen III oxidase